MATQLGLTIVKRFTYRGDASEEFSNTYHFSGDIPADETAWKALADALIVQEKTCYLGTAAVVRAYGYNDDADNAASVWSYDYLAHAASVAGTASVGSGTYSAGDQAAWVRWETTRRASGRKIYLRKYFHCVPTTQGSAGNPDGLVAAYVTALQAFGTKLRDGSFTDGRIITARGHADAPVSSAASLYVTTRTLKRRGKRPGA